MADAAEAVETTEKVEESVETTATTVEETKNVAEDSEMTEVDASENVATDDAEMADAEKKEIEVTTNTEAAETTEKAEEAKKEETPKKKVYVRPQIYVGNVADDTTEEEIKEHFSKFGELSAVVMPKGHRGIKPHRGFAFISYKDQSIAPTVIVETHKLGGRELNLDKAKPKTKKFFIGNLDKGVTEKSTIRTYFSKFGEITDILNMKNKGFAFVTMIDDGENIKNILDSKHEIDGKIRDVKTAKPKQDTPQRGGRGGRGRGRRRGDGNGRRRKGRGGGWGPMAYGPYGGWGYGMRFSPYGPFPGAYGDYYDDEY